MLSLSLLFFSLPLSTLALPHHASGGPWRDWEDGGLPKVDLGYEVHQAISFNETRQTYNFTNIRFAQPPVGDLRFAAPVAPSGRNTEVQNGDQPRICPQASPAWGLIARQFVTAVAYGNTSNFNYTMAVQQVEQYIASGAANTGPTPGETEDCLFLDVHVPKKVFDGAQKGHWHHQGGSGGAPVLVWIYGGGYVGGQKGGMYNPSGLINASQADGSDGIVFVAMNYRLGAFGFMAGETLQAAGGVSNAGLYDQRLALEWVQQNIHLFGGDPNKVTVMGESAGGGSIEFQLTAFGGSKPVPFQRVIPQSPGFVPINSPETQEIATQGFLSVLNVTTIAEARTLGSSAVITANKLQVGAAPYSSYIYGPVPDGIFAPELPALLLASGRHAKNIDVMNGHNANEAPLFTPPFVQNNDDLRAFIKSTYPGIPPSSLDYIINTLYPAVYDGTHGYTSNLERLFEIISDSSFVCNTNFINKAFDNATYAYEFQVPPAFHGFDIPYTFYNGGSGVIVPIALAMQAYITNFVKTGDPNGAGVPRFPMQGENARLNGINATGIRTQRDPTVNPRCAWWELSLTS